MFVTTSALFQALFISCHRISFRGFAKNHPFPSLCQEGNGMRLFWNTDFHYRKLKREVESKIERSPAIWGGGCFLNALLVLQETRKVFWNEVVLCNVVQRHLSCACLPAGRSVTYCTVPTSTVYK